MADNETGSPFERIRHTTDDGEEYWSARELAKLLGYAKWDKFTNVIEKAKIACESSSHAPSDHFLHVGKLIIGGKGAQRDIGDWHLSRYACYLIVQNADPEKPIVGLGQTYFAVQTRRAELADELAGLTEPQKRLALRQQMASRNVELAAAASEAGW
jgi:DNA-damage-inducible protein D